MTLTVLRLKSVVACQEHNINHMGILQQCTRFDLEDALRVGCNCGPFYDTTRVPIDRCHDNFESKIKSNRCQDNDFDVKE